MPSASKCFETCDCHCNDVDTTFDALVAKELRSATSLRDICHSEIHWFCDRSVNANDPIDLKGLPRRSGVYILWHKDDYCDVHGVFHMRALYVGKGNQATRLRCHWASKDFSEQLLIYYSFYPLANRLAKYTEQLLLDTYDFPLNHSENTGIRKLCAYFQQAEVD